MQYLVINNNKNNNNKIQKITEENVMHFFIAGRIHTGMSIVKRIGLVETDKNDRPIDDVKITKGSIKNI